MEALISRAAAAALLATLAVVPAGAQDLPVPPARPTPPADTAPPQIPIAPAPPAAAAPPDVEAPSTEAPETSQAQPSRPWTAPPTEPARPVRAPVAILRVLDKVSAQTMAFAAPIGRRVRYKSLVFEVRACETADPQTPGPHTSAYLIITSDSAAPTEGVLGRRQLFKGWMFAESPSLRPFRHPVYDAWLVSCAAEAPAA